METLYEIAKNLKIIPKDRWENSIPHHPKSKQLMEFLKLHDYNDYDDYFGWKSGGDDDNGEILMYQLDAFFELMDTEHHRTWG
jgi:hypothetical protein